MKSLEQNLKKFKEFKPTSWAVNNKAAIYLLIIIVSFMGVNKFVTMPKEQFPDIVLPTIYVQTVYVGNSPKDIENLVTKPIEKQIKGITGAKITKVTSTSQQDFSAVIVEFQTDVETDEALRKVKDAVDKARIDLPKDLTSDPNVMEVSFSDFPIMYVNVSGNYDLMRLKKIADDMQDRIEDLPQVNRVDIVGAPEREFQINVDRLRMQANGVTYDDIANAVARENMDISAGQLDVGDMKRTLQLKGQFHTAYDIEQIVLNNIRSSPIYLKDIATIKDTVKTTESYARLNGKNVITLNIIKRPGENLIETSDAVKGIIAELKEKELPKDLDVVVTGDLSKATKSSFNDLVNSIVIGFIFVLVILMFFMGVVNAFFVALSVPLSIFVAFIFIPAADLIVGTHVTLNFIVLFALLFGLGIIVDDAIVVIENTHRIYMQGHGKTASSIAAKVAAGEVWAPVLSGTLTTLAPFVPLLFWPGIIGKFMIYLPTMLIFTLTASLIVAFIMNPVFAVDFMNHEEGKRERKTAIFRKPLLWILLGIGILLDVSGQTFGGNLLITLALLMLVNRFVLDGAIRRFQHSVLPWIMNHYESMLRWALKGWRPVHLLLGTFALMFFSVMLFNMRTPPPNQFPSGDPNQVYVYIKLPVGTSVEHTNEVTKEVEAKVNKVLGMDNGKPNPLVESVISNVAAGANDPNTGDQSAHPEQGRIQVSFVEYALRDGKSTRPYLDTLRRIITAMPGVELTVDQESNGPPQEAPVSIEVSSEDFDALIKTSVRLKNYLDSLQIKDMPPMKMNVDLTNPEVSLTIDRERCMLEGLSSAQVGQEIRTALFGREVSKIKEGTEEYKIQLRNDELQRKDIASLLNMSITFRDFATGAVKQVPIISLVKVDYTNTLGSVKRKDYKRTIILTSNAEQSLSAQINAELLPYLNGFKEKPSNVSIAQAGADAQMTETFNFLGTALFIAFGMILIILVLQFNSISKPVIILTEILFSVIGVLLGYGITGMQPSIVMTGIGIVGLAGIVVKNGILVIEFADELRGRGLKTREAVVQAGKTRIIPVLLTALAAILALIPLAVGFNINFVTLFSELNPHIYFGGDNQVFWAPLSWTIIFGLTFAFFMTLVIVPSMYLIAERLRRPMRHMYGGRWISLMGIPPLTLVFIPLMIITMIRHRIAKARRKRKLKNERVNEAFVGSWF